jgi:hypothetical protein
LVWQLLQLIVTGLFTLKLTDAVFTELQSISVPCALMVAAIGVPVPG